MVKDRFQRLLQLQERVSLEANRALLGTEVELLVERSASKTNPTRMSGRTRTNKLCHFPAGTHPQDPPTPVEPGDLVTVRVEQAAPTTWSGGRCCTAVPGRRPVVVPVGARPAAASRRGGAAAAGRLTGPPMAPVAAAVLPHPPLLVAELAGAAAAELDPLRAACRQALTAVTEAADLTVVVGDGPVWGVPEPSAPGSFHPYGADVEVALPALVTLDLPGLPPPPASPIFPCPWPSPPTSWPPSTRPRPGCPPPPSRPPSARAPPPPSAAP